MAQQPNRLDAWQLAPEKEMTPTDRLSRTGTGLAANSCPFERFPRGRYEE